MTEKVEIILDRELPFNTGLVISVGTVLDAEETWSSSSRIKYWKITWHGRKDIVISTNFAHEITGAEKFLIYAERRRNNDCKEHTSDH